MVVLGRVAYLAWLHDFRISLIWFVKLVTDPFTDIKAYLPRSASAWRAFLPPYDRPDEPRSTDDTLELAGSAGALSLERFWYAWVWHHPESFRRFCSKPLLAIFGEPVDVLRNFFVCFKTLQLAVFFGWCYLYGDGTVIPPGEDGPWIAMGGILIAIGQVLNVGRFHPTGQDRRLLRKQTGLSGALVPELSFFSHAPPPIRRRHPFDLGLLYDGQISLRRLVHPSTVADGAIRGGCIPGAMTRIGARTPETNLPLHSINLISP